jgi:hypothetical protein
MSLSRRRVSGSKSWRAWVDRDDRRVRRYSLFSFRQDAGERSCRATDLRFAHARKAAEQAWRQNNSGNF